MIADAIKIHRRGRGVKQTGGKPRANRQVRSGSVICNRPQTGFGGSANPLCYAERPALPPRERPGACQWLLVGLVTASESSTRISPKVVCVGRASRSGCRSSHFKVLIALLERHGEVVTRDELRKRLWPGDTFVEFDKSLGVALAKLRAALGDDAANPRFVETVPRRGYRFIAPVTVQDDAHESLPAALVSASVPPGAPSLHLPVLLSRWNQSWCGARTSRLRVAAALVVLGIIAAGALYWRSRASSAAPASMSIVIAQFANSTGETAFDGSLRRATSVALRQSPFLNVTTDASINEALQRSRTGAGRSRCRRGWRATSAGICTKPG